ncbi:MAG: DedA family protein [Actinobacteria bacterium]|nr:DedA family protein [Actinomycetota bacterium]
MLVASVLSGVTGALENLVGDHALYAVFGLMLIDAVLPAASELVMVYGGAIAAGAFAGQDVVLLGERIGSGFGAFLAIVSAGTLGYTLGSLGGWALGIYGGRPLLERHGRWLHLGPAQLARAERWFDRFGDAAVLVGRITPVARSFISIPAGVFRYALGRYTLLTLIGSTLWCVALAGVGWALGTRWEQFHEAFRYVDYAVAAGVVAFVAYFIARRRRSHRLARHAPDSPR